LGLEKEFNNFKGEIGLGDVELEGFFLTLYKQNEQESGHIFNWITRNGFRLLAKFSKDKHELGAFNDNNNEFIDFFFIIYENKSGDIIFRLKKGTLNLKRLLEKLGAPFRHDITEKDPYHIDLNFKIKFPSITFDFVNAFEFQIFETKIS
jgi:hypothetical protein